MHRYLRGSCLAALALGASFVLCGRPVLAHRIKVFAYAEGAKIIGSVYFPGGGKARNVAVVVLGPEGRKLGEVTTDETGAFAFEATARCDHTFVFDSKDGHRAQYTLKADELPRSLAGPDDATGAGPGVEPPTEAELPDAAGPEVAGAFLQSDLEQAVERAVARQIGLLRQQLDKQEERRRFRDVLGGVGYIFGIAGVAFFLLARRKRTGSG
jgi:nickel transport protein